MKAPCDKKIPKYQRLTAAFRSRISSGELQPGYRLPTFAELSAEFGATTTTVSRVYAALEQEGLVRRSHGSGVYVAKQRRIATGLIGFVGFQQSKTKEFGSHLFISHLQDGAREAARKHGLHLMLLDDDSLPDVAERLDGVISGMNSSEPVAFFGTPHVHLLTKLRGVPSVVADEECGVRSAVEHLMELGHRRIGYLLSGIEPYHSLRLAAYESTLRQHGIEPNPRWVRHLRDIWRSPTSFVGAAQERMTEWLQEDWDKLGCTALLCQNDQTAIGVITALHAAGKRVPEDVSVVGFDGTEAAEYSRPVLTTVKLPLFEIGARGVDLLVQELNGQSPPELTEIPALLEIGGSTAPLRKL